MRYRISQIKTDQFAVFEENFNPKSVVNLNTNLTYGPISGNNIFGVTAKFNFENKSKVFITIQVSCFFEIDNEDWKNQIKGIKITFPKVLVSHLALITVGTTRGILHTKTEGTIFNKYVIPFTNVEELIAKDVEFVLD